MILNGNYHVLIYDGLNRTESIINCQNIIKEGEENYLVNQLSYLLCCSQVVSRAAINSARPAERVGYMASH